MPRLDFGKALLAGSALERPREMSIAADIDRATLAGLQARDARARIRVDANGLQIDRLSAGDFAGGSFAASGRVDTGGRAPRGNLSVDFEAKQTAAVAAMAGKFAPKSAEPVIGLPIRSGTQSCTPRSMSPAVTNRRQYGASGGHRRSRRSAH